MKEIEVLSGKKRTSGSILIVFSFWRRTTSVISTRTTATAVNIDRQVPRIMVTAKPRTGPEPNMNSRLVAISEVTLASTMVEIGALEAVVQRGEGADALLRFLAYSFVDQDVGVHAEADAEDDAGDAGQGQRRADDGQRADGQDEVQQQAEIGDHAPAP